MKQKYMVDIPRDVPIGNFMIKQLSKHPSDSIAMTDIESGLNVSYGELIRNVKLLAVGLQVNGLREGDTVAMICHNHVKYPEVVLAIWLAGGIVTTMNPLYTKLEIKDQLGRMPVSYIFTNLNCSRAIDESLDETNTSNNIKTVLIGSGKWGTLRYDKLLSDGAGVALRASSQAVRASTRQLSGLVIFSSGTSGLPKGVLLSQYNIVASICQNIHPSFNYMAPGSETIVCLPPFFHCYGLLFILMHGLFTGQRMIAVPKFQPEQYLASIQKYKATYIPVAPPIVTFLLKNRMVDKYDLSSLRTILSGASTLTSEVSQEFVVKFPHIVLRQGYGMTEMSLSHISPKSGPKFGSIGVPVPNTECKIVDNETGIEKKIREHGEMWISGPQVMIGYLNNQKATDEILTSDGWIKTGDIGYEDEDGHIYIVDRLKEIIKYNGYQVSPGWLEGLLTCHPEVQDAAVVGIPAGTIGHLPKAFVVRRPGSEVTAEEIVKYVKENAVGYKHLRGGVTFVESIPKSSTGKILRRLLNKSKL